MSSLFIKHLGPWLPCFPTNDSLDSKNKTETEDNLQVVKPGIKGMETYPNYLIYPRRLKETFPGVVFT